MGGEFLDAISEFPGEGAGEVIGVEPGAKSSFIHRETAPSDRDQEPERLTCNPTPEP